MKNLAIVEYAIWRERYYLNRFQCDQQESIDEYNITFLKDQLLEEIDEIFG